MGVDKTLKACRKANMSSTACITALIVLTELFQDNFTLFVIVVVQKKTSTVEDVSHHDEELSFHDSLSDDELQEVQNDHATYTSGFASKDDIQDVHRLYISLGTKKCMTGYITVKQIMGVCVKSARFSMGNHQCQQEGEEVLGVTTR